MLTTNELVGSPTSVSSSSDTGSFVEVADTTMSSTQAPPTLRSPLPADPTLNFTGHWKLLVTDDFSRSYDTYLARLGQPMLVRSIAGSVIGRTTEQTRLMGDGTQLYIASTNPRGVWERVLDSSSSSTTIFTADKEQVQAEAWWEGNVHHSWLKGVTKYGGGSFESRRYLEGMLLCCESTFHPNDPQRPAAQVTWRFTRTG